MLIKALTGIDTDRLKEEIERGMTIEPGFANLKLPSGKVASVVDVPGHERFIKNMLRGVSGIDIAVLVVASDDGVMPQTKEHLDILKLLNIQHGLIVLSKIDLVDDEVRLMAAEEVRSLVRETFLEDAPIVPFSAKTGQGIGGILRSIEDISRQVAEKDQNGTFRLSIDRAFTMAGYGTIVTGTVASGRIKQGDAAEIYPIGTTTSARNIQIHNRWVGEAVVGHRAGINLSNVKVESLERGMVLGEPGSLTTTHIINARFLYLPSNRHPIKDRTKVKFYAGTSEVIARVILMEKEKLDPGETSFVQFRLEGKAVLLPYDRYIIRTLSPVNTIGGGMVLEIGAKKHRSAQPGSVDRLKVLERRIDHEMVETFIRKEGFRPVKLSGLTNVLRLTQTEIKSACDHLLGEGKVVFVEDDLLIHKESRDHLKTEILAKLNGFHANNPNLKDASREDIRSRVFPVLHQRLYDDILQELKYEGKIDIEQGRLRISGFRLRLDEKQKHIYDHLDKTCRDHFFRPLPLNVLTRIKDRYGVKEVESVLMFMIGEGRLVRLNNHRLIHAEAIEEIKRRLKEHIEKSERVALAEFVEVLGLGRTQLQPIFDYLDAIRFTMRIGDYRVLHKGVKEAQDPTDNKI